MIRHLVLLGLGPGHQLLLRSLRKKRPADIAISLLTRQERAISTTQLLSAVSGRVPVADCGLELEPLVRQSGVRWLDQQVRAIDPSAKLLLLDDGRELRFDWLSLEPEPAQNRDQIERGLPGARANGLFVRPHEAFCKLWPRVVELATQRPLRLAVVGGQAGSQAGEVTAPLPLKGDGDALQTCWLDDKFAIELAFAVRQAFKDSAVTLITGGAPVAAEASPALQRSIHGALKKRRITVLADAASAIQNGEIILGTGARLACEVPLLALQPNAHLLAGASGLALDEAGFVKVDAAQRSTSHTHVFAAEHDNAETAPALAASLLAVMEDKMPPLRKQAGNQGSAWRAQVVRCSDGQAIASLGNWAWSGRLAHLLAAKSAC